MREEEWKVPNLPMVIILFHARLAWIVHRYKLQALAIWVLVLLVLAGRWEVVGRCDRLLVSFYVFVLPWS